MSHRPESREEMLDELSLHLGWASRSNPATPSRKHLRKLFETAPVLNLLEELVNAAAVPPREGDGDAR